MAGYFLPSAKPHLFSVLTFPPPPTQKKPEAPPKKRSSFPPTFKLQIQFKSLKLKPTTCLLIYKCVYDEGFDFIFSLAVSFSTSLPTPPSFPAIPVPAEPYPSLYKSHHVFVQIPNSLSLNHQRCRPCWGDKIHVIVGPMFTGKTIALLRRVNLEDHSGRNVAMIKSSKDTRYAVDSVVTHDETKYPCWALPNLMSFRHKFGADTYDKLDVMGIDEAQFFGDLYEFQS